MSSPAALRAITLPWSWYSDPDVARLERDRIFRRSWQYAGRVDELTAPSSYLATHAGGLPAVVTRDRDDRLRAFANVCRHRGAIVAHGTGERGTLQCPYHAWTYGLDGCLRAAPRAGDALDRGELGLVPMAVGSWGPFLFVNPDPDAPPLADALGDLPDEVAAHGLDVDELVFHHRVHYEIAANWKIALENYLECYHCQLNHPALSDLVDERRMTLGARGLRASQFVPAHPDALAGAAPFDIARGTPAGQFHLLLPATKLNTLPGPANLSIGPLWPLAPDRCAAYLDYFFAPGLDDDWIAAMLAFDDVVGAEDTALVEDAQRGTSSGLLDHGHLLGDAEALIAHFQDWVQARLA